MLPMMNCDPIRIHIDLYAKTVVALMVRIFLLHLQEAVKQQLDKDVALGTQGHVAGQDAHFMKPDSTPRCTADLRHIKDH